MVAIGTRVRMLEITCQRKLKARVKVSEKVYLLIGGGGALNCEIVHSRQGVQGKCFCWRLSGWAVN